MAVSIKELWEIVDTSEQTRKHCMMMENVNYGREELMYLNMVRQGVIGDLLYGEAAYIHELRGQMKQVEQFKKMEEKKIPENINYDEIQSLRIEAKQKLNLYRPINIGQASRISGVSPADISVLLVYLGHK